MANGLKRANGLRANGLFVAVTAALIDGAKWVVSIL